MKEQTRLDALALCNAAERMREAANLLWWARNPEDGGDGEPPSLKEAQEAHADAFITLLRAKYHMRRSLEREETSHD